MNRNLIGLLLLILVSPVCGEARAEEPLKVVATNSILADLVHQIGGHRITVTCLIRPGVEAHTFQPTPEDVAVMAKAALVVENGLGLEGWLHDLILASGFRGPLITASAGITSLTNRDDHDHHGIDPHAWQDLTNGIRYATNIRDGLVARDPQGSSDYNAWCEAYCGQLRVVDAWVRRQIGLIPRERRVVITSHEALAYFGHAYGLEINSVEGVTTGQEPDPKHIVTLIDLIRSRHIPAVFIEASTAPGVVERLGREAGVHAGGTLFSDSLAPIGQPGDSYIGMFLLNTRTLVGGLNER